MNFSMSGWRSKKDGGGAVCLICLCTSTVSVITTVVILLTDSGSLFSGKFPAVGFILSSFTKGSIFSAGSSATTKRLV